MFRPRNHFMYALSFRSVLVCSVHFSSRLPSHRAQYFYFAWHTFSSFASFCPVSHYKSMKVTILTSPLVAIGSSSSGSGDVDVETLLQIVRQEILDSPLAVPLSESIEHFLAYLRSCPSLSGQALSLAVRSSGTMEDTVRFSNMSCALWYSRSCEGWCVLRRSV